MTKKYISAKYIKEKSFPIEQLLDTINSSDTDNIANKIHAEEIAYAFAVIAKEIGVEIPEV